MDTLKMIPWFASMSVVNSPMIEGLFKLLTFYVIIRKEFEFITDLQEIIFILRCKKIFFQLQGGFSNGQSTFACTFKA